MIDPLQQLLAALDPDPRRAAERYEQLRARLLDRFCSRHLPAPEDLADETFDRVARRLHEGERPRDVAGYILGAGRLVALEAARRMWRTERLDDEAEAAPVADLDREQKIEVLAACLAELPEPARQLLLRYEGEDRIATRRRLARELGIGSNALRIRVHRLRDQLHARMAAAGA